MSALTLLLAAAASTGIAATSPTPPPAQPAAKPAATRAFQFNDLGDIDRLTGVTLAPNGEDVVLTLERHYNYGGRKTSLVLVSPRDRTRRPIGASGETDATLPAWSADGSLLSYVARRDNRVRLSLVKASTLAPIALPDVCPGGNVQDASWAPAGTRLVVLCRATPPPPADEGDIVIATKSVLFSSRPYDPAVQSLVFVDAAAPTGWQTVPLAALTTIVPSRGRQQLIWDPAGREIFFTATTTDDPGGSYSDNGFIAAADSRTLAVRRVTEGAKPLVGVDLSPDGKSLLVIDSPSISAAETFWQYVPFTLWRGALKRGAGADAGLVVDTAAAPQTTVWKDVYHAPALVPNWVPAANGAGAGVVYFGLFERGAYRLYAFDPATGARTAVTPADKHVAAYSVTADGKTIALIMSDPNTPAEVFLLKAGQPAQSAQAITNFGDDIRATHQVSEVSRRQWKSKDGKFEVDGWLVKPYNYQPGKRYPLIVNVHGGPGVAYTHSFMRLHYDDGGNQVAPELYAAHGYMVLMVNPRGDMSYGPEYMHALVGKWPDATNFDIFAGVDDAIQRGEADPDRLGIAGASYGGFVSTFAITQTDRFKAASANDPATDEFVAAPVAYRGRTAVSNYDFHANWFGGLPGTPEYKAPIFDLPKIKTPILLRFGLNSGDPRMPSQFFMSGLGYFVYLHKHRIPVEMIMHPKDGHGIMTVDRIRDYNERNMAWFDYWIQGKPYPDAALQKEFDEWKAKGRTPTSAAAR